MSERCVGSCPGVAKTGRSGCVYAGASYMHPRARGSPRCCSAGRKQTQGKVQVKEEGTSGGEWPRACCRAESGGLRGDFPPLESSPEEGIPESFRLSCQVSFLQHKLNFLPPACGWQRRNGLCPGSEGAPLLRVSHKSLFSLKGTPTSASVAHGGKRLILLQNQLVRVDTRLGPG